MPLGANKAAIMGVAGVSTGDVVLISSQTASGDSAITFNSGITSTYGEYIFKFYNINPATDGENFTFQANAVDASGYNETMTTTYVNAYHFEDDSATSLAYTAARDQGQGTGYQQLSDNVGNEADQSCVGELHLFNPAGTTYVKHFTATMQEYADDSVSSQKLVAGYFNITAAIDDIQFKMSSGNFDGKIKMWGVK